MGIGEHDNQVYLIGFSLARRYRDPKTRLHISYKEKHNLTGTAPYASINNHLGVEQSHRDDLESIAYVLIYFLCGSLPWLGAKPTAEKQQWDITLQMKMNTPPDILCSACPTEFSIFLSYVC
jgi:casein kinase I homolog HRR25